MKHSAAGGSTGARAPGGTADAGPRAGSQTAPAPGRPAVLYVNNRYRLYDRLKYETLARAFRLRVIWISPPPPSDPLPEELARACHHRILSDRPEILKPWHLLRGARLVALVLKHGAKADLVLSSGSMDWKSKLTYAAARLVRATTALRVETWSERRKKLRGVRRLYWALQDRLARFIETRADAVFVGGVKAREYVESRGVDPGRILLFHYLHDDFAQYRPDLDFQAGIRRRLADGPVFLYAGRIIPKKGLLVLIGAFRRLLAEGHRANLLVVGKPIGSATGRGEPSLDYYEECRRRAARERRIVFWGYVESSERVHDCFRVADVFVHPHVRRVAGAEVHEGWGQVITEAASLSLPIITTDRVASAFDVVRDGKNGFLVSTEDLEDGLLQAMRACITQPRLLADFGAESRRLYESFVSAPRTVESVQRAIDRGRGSRLRSAAGSQGSGSV